MCRVRQGCRYKEAIRLKGLHKMQADSIATKDQLAEDSQQHAAPMTHDKQFQFSGRPREDQEKG